jgi:hypothetical protein
VQAAVRLIHDIFDRRVPVFPQSRGDCHRITIDHVRVNLNGRVSSRTHPHPTSSSCRIRVRLDTSPYIAKPTTQDSTQTRSGSQATSLAELCGTPGSFSQLDLGHVLHPTKLGGLGDDFIKIFEHGDNFSKNESEKA